MMIPVVLVLLAVLALLVFVISARRRASAVSDLSELRERTRPVDILAFRNLVDPVEKEFLRQRLEPRQFRTIQRERLRVAVEYTKRVSENAVILSQIGDAARTSADPHVSQAGEQLVNTALRVRIYSLETRARLYAAIVLPSMPLSHPRVSDSYERLTSTMVRLGRLQKQSGKLSAA
jgi:hypothetical protein